MAQRGCIYVKIRTFVVYLTIFLALGAAHATITVGNCKSATNPYKTISEAIQASPAYEVIEVCPGTYAEQITIDKPLTIRGMVVEGQSGVTITPPATGLVQLPGLYSTYAQIFADNANGPVNLSNLTVQSGLFVTEYGALDFSEACNFISDSAGVYYANTPGSLDHLNIVGQFGSLSGAGTEGYDVPNCGNGIEFHNERGTHVAVRQSTVTQAGLFGIYSATEMDADHNIIAVSGPSSVGISTALGTITNNTITGSLNYKSTGISGGESVQGNVVQSAAYGITGAKQVQRNMLLNNSISIVGDSASDNLIYSHSTYLDPTNPACQEGAGGLACNLPTVGIDLGCQKHRDMTNNGIFDVGIGVANVPVNEHVSDSNLFTGDTSVSTSCGQ